MGYAVKIAENGIIKAAKADRALALGINTYAGHVTCEGVAQAHKLEYVPVEKAFG
jgi:alanine dehydrogenase